MSLINDIQIARLKARARRQYDKYCEIRDGLDCGNAMANAASASLGEARAEFNATMDELAKIDPNCIPERL